MDLNPPFLPKPAEINLMFTCQASGSIKDLRSGIRTFLTAYYPSGVAWRMAIAPSYNYVVSHDRSKRSIMLTADGSAVVASVLLDLFARLLSMHSTVVTARGAYLVSLDGALDLQRVHALTSHFMWVREFFDQDCGAKTERHLLN